MVNRSIAAVDPADQSGIAAVHGAVMWHAAGTAGAVPRVCQRGPRRGARSARSERARQLLRRAVKRTFENATIAIALAGCAIDNDATEPTAPTDQLTTAVHDTLAMPANTDVL